MDKQSTISPEGLDRAILVWMQELSPHGICVTDEKLRIQGWNLWLETASGMKRETVMGQSLLEVFPELQIRRLDAYLQKALKGEISVLSVALHKYLFPLPSPLRDADFPNMLQTARIAPLVQDAEIVGTIITIEDVTQREHQNALLRKQSERQNLISWALVQLLHSRDPESMVKEILPKVSNHLGVDAYFNYLLDEDGEYLRLHSFAGISTTVEKEILHRKPGESPCESSAKNFNATIWENVHESSDPQMSWLKQIGLCAYICQPLRVEGKVLGTLAFGSRTRTSFDPEEIQFTQVVAQHIAIAIERFRNFDLLRKAQKELARHAESLEEKVQERTADLQESVAELESFSYSLAHDVRAPLRHILGYAQILLEDFSDDLKSPARVHVNSIIQAIERLNRLTNDMLSYAQLSRNASRMVPVDIEHLIREIITRNPGLAAHEVVVMKLPLHPVLGEPLLLDQCLGNFLDNAIKFVVNGTEPRIVIRTELKIHDDDAPAAEHKNRKWVRIWIEDNGIGIPPDFHVKIFGIFERLTTHPQGTGIGLAIVSKAIQKMNGRLGVESEVGRGSRFWMELPAAE